MRRLPFLSSISEPGGNPFCLKKRSLSVMKALPMPVRSAYPRCCCSVSSTCSQCSEQLFLFPHLQVLTLPPPCSSLVSAHSFSTCSRRVKCPRFLAPALHSSAVILQLLPTVNPNFSHMPASVLHAPGFCM